MAIAHYCPKPVWPLSRPGFTVITPKVQKPTHCSDAFQHLVKLVIYACKYYYYSVQSKGQKLFTVYLLKNVNLKFTEE